MKIILLLVASLSLISCTSSESTTSASVGTAGTIFGKATGSIGAAGAVLSGAGFRASSLLNDNCEDMITDLAVDASGSAEYLGCLLTKNTKNPETVLGSFHIVSKVMEMLEGQISFNYMPAFTTHEDVTGSVNTSEGDQIVELSLKERSLSGAWDYHVKICMLSVGGAPFNSTIADCESDSYTYEIYLKDGGNQLGFKTIERFGSFSGGTSFLIDSATDELRFEGWDESNGRHMRVYAKGTVSDDYVLSGVTDTEIASASQQIEVAGDGTDALYANFDGSNLCINTWDDDDADHSNGAGNGTANLTAQGTCGSFPAYEGGFLNTSGLEAFLENDAKGILNFSNLSFGVSNYFIDN